MLMRVSAMSFSLMLVRTVTARIFNEPFSRAAASMTARWPCTVRKAAPLRARLAVARRTVSGMSCSLRSANTLLPRRASHSTSSK